MFQQNMTTIRVLAILQIVKEAMRPDAEALPIHDLTARARLFALKTIVHDIASTTRKLTR